MLSQMTFEDMSSATTSQESADGLTLYALPDGPTINPSGRGVARVSRSPLRQSLQKLAPKARQTSGHLMPEFARLICERRPSVVFGEQVRNAIKWWWLDDAFGALEAAGYACGAAVMPALSVGAAHERNRLYWMAYAGGQGRPGHQPIERLSVAASAPFPVDGDPLTRARRALDGDYSDLLHCDGLSVVMERSALKGYGNAIVPQVAAEFIKAAAHSITQIDHL
jgi:hypothetical protein